MPDVWAQRPKAYGVYGAMDTSKLCDGWSSHGFCLPGGMFGGVDDVAREPQGNQPTFRGGSCMTSGSPTSTHIVSLQLLACNGGYLLKMTESGPIDRTLIVGPVNEILTESYRGLMEHKQWFGEGGHAGNVTRKDLRYGRWMEKRLTFPQDGKVSRAEAALENGDEAVSPWQVRIPIRLFALLLPSPPLN
ncbi:uncharacterized protein BO96DRAFT_465199 [Aspergillus niger CBS 101883]|uniref:uncharacterized protein n=1 Tax=Aspergillus lacticoffeatus (strain CBS 101883) TaxID=1450533 RepID=UPI000D7F6F7B|nr:uncharacterized protein BO96DRAFT_465199 [Aspergillus niger CBS 101883]PYH57578.1 hypothetical protein BO96DRAFT_465199 [Aspergillus niger CBS 101883]